jgi:hypothetical protein
LENAGGGATLGSPARTVVTMANRSHGHANRLTTSDKTHKHTAVRVALFAGPPRHSHEG